MQQISTTQHGAVRSTDAKTVAPEDGGTPEPQNGSETPSADKGLTEARDRYRAERDTAREELHALAQRIERMQRTDIERLAGEHLSMPADLFSLSGNTVADYLTEDGQVDADKVAADVAEILTERPGLRKGPVRGFDPTQGFGGEGRIKPTEPSFADLFIQNARSY